MFRWRGDVAKLKDDLRQVYLVRMGRSFQSLRIQVTLNKIKLNKGRDQFVCLHAGAAACFLLVAMKTNYKTSLNYPRGIFCEGRFTALYSARELQSSCANISTYVTWALCVLICWQTGGVNGCLCHDPTGAVEEDDSTGRAGSSGWEALVSSGQRNVSWRWDTLNKPNQHRQVLFYFEIHIIL